ncbi:MAG: hypothetical protein IT326_03840 [Anaerolineae bacterium]|nr:hypothetical protein [Anaerolineae bacterium]
MIAFQYAPYALRAGWDTAQGEALADRALAALEPTLPGLTARVRDRRVLTPADLEARYGLPEGDFNHGAMMLDQAFFQRPALGLSDYRMPVAGLWLCGPGAHPGGGHLGAPGFAAAQTALGS